MGATMNMSFVSQAYKEAMIYLDIALGSCTQKDIDDLLHRGEVCTDIANFCKNWVCVDSNFNKKKVE